MATPVQQLLQLPEHFLELLRVAAPQALTSGFHTLDCDMRDADLLEMYCGSARVASLCSRVSRLLARFLFLQALSVCAMPGQWSLIACCKICSQGWDGGPDV